MAINKDNNCELDGYISNPPQHGSFQGKEGPVTYCNFSFCINHKTKGPMFFNAKAYGTMAENIKKTTSKGDSVRIWGEAMCEQWKDDPTKYNNYYLVHEFKNATTIYGSKDKPFEQQEMYSSNQPLPDTPARF